MYLFIQVPRKFLHSVCTNLVKTLIDFHTALSQGMICHIERVYVKAKHIKL